MGKLAERLADAARSGVYRVASTEAVEEAAALNGYRVLRLDGKETLPPDMPEVVLLLEAPDDALLSLLERRAERARKRGECFFAAFVDPEEKAAFLRPLYNWRKP